MTAISVSTPSRLHFGLLRTHASQDRSFGGLGMMIDRPRVEVQISPSSQWQATGPEAQRATEFARRALGSIPSPNKPEAFAIEVVSIVPQHRGLGGGTQLALALAAGVRELADLPPGDAAQLAAAVDRGARSAVGSHGFIHGGIIWERGRTAGDGLAALTTRISAPNDWRIVLVAPSKERGLSGDAERAAFDELPPTPFEVTNRLETLAEEQILPAASAANTEAFGEAIYEYGRLSGECFASVQGGSYASSEVADCVAAIRKLGVRGVGQSSWGPTVFAITANLSAASELVASLFRDARWKDYALDIVAPDNRGAQIRKCAT